MSQIRHPRRPIVRILAGLFIAVASIFAAAGGARAQTPPAPAPTPWPAPHGLTVGIVSNILGPDGSTLIPPQERVWQAVAGWDVPPGFTGNYEIQWARQRRGETGLSYTNFGSRAASAAVGGRLRVAENITFADAMGARWCFRVRTLTDQPPPPPGTGGRGIEPGPWAEACSQLPPTSGPAPLAAPPSVSIHIVYLNTGGGDYDTEARFRWTPVPGFDGQYEVERAYVPALRPGGAPNRAAPHAFTPIATVPAAVGADGWIAFTDTVPYARMWFTPPCYRARAVRGDERGPYSGEACAVLAPHNSPPAGLAPLTAPPAVGMGMRYLDPAGAGGDYDSAAALTWAPVPGVVALYEVERAYVPIPVGGGNVPRALYDAPHDFRPIATVAAAVGANGRVTYTETVPYALMWDSPPCYRVRAVRGEERGPYSGVACAFLATDNRPPAGRVPRAPDLGSGSGDGDGDGASWLLAAGGLALLAGAAAGLGARLHRS